MKKRAISILLLCAMTLSLFAGCGKGSGKTAKVAPMPTEEEQAEIFVEKIDNLSSDFIKGMDISILLAEEASGVKYYDADGNEQDLMKILADAGVNYIRVRVWNDPFDENGNGYGGGNCNVDTACEIGKRAAAYGMKLCVDFHYSDFWADPNKQMCPKAWVGMDLDEKAEALYQFTKESLEKIQKSGADIGMVQIGNEINNGMAGQTKIDDVMTLLCAGSKAVREVDENIQIAVHYTSIDDAKQIKNITYKLASAGVDYDVFGVSYYYFWHGSFENLKNVLQTVQDTYGVKTCIMETSYLYTTEDGDCNGNSVSEPMPEYPASPQGQATLVRDVMAAASEVGALGVFYWEGAWTPVGSDYESNSKLWEEYGSGWASSYAAGYDPKDAGQYYGGSSWDNQAFFDFEGHVLPSLNVFKYVNYGAVADTVEVIKVNDLELEVAIGEELTLPTEVEGIFNDARVKDTVAVEWDSAQVAAFDPYTAGTIYIDGIAGGKLPIQAKVKVANKNYVVNPSFEDADTSMWKVDSVGSNPTDVQEKAADAFSGTKAFHFYSTADMDFAVSQTITGLASGTYNACANLQGGDTGANQAIYLEVQVGDMVYQSANIQLTGWQDWKTVELKDIPVEDGQEVILSVRYKVAAKGWGTLDDIEFYCQN